MLSSYKPVTIAKMSSDRVLTRRERLRAEALQEIRRHGYDQIAAGGPTALSLNGIAKAMGMSGPALYRYFASRDELLVTLVTESFEDLAHTLEAAADAARDTPPETRLRIALNAYRNWARTSPHRYRLIFGSTYGTGELDPDRIIPAAGRSMAVVLAGLDLGSAGPNVDSPRLRREIQRWGKLRAGGQISDPGVLLLGLLAWSRAHGIVSLEIEGFYDQVDVDPSLLYEAEIQHLIDQRTNPEAAGRPLRGPPDTHQDR
jgi:AcrR family transcriptional regulator